MVINAVCPHCKRVYPVDEQYAGQTFSCETCGNPFTVPVPGIFRPAAPASAVPIADQGPGEISRHRRLSARICFILCGLMFVGAFCCGIGGAAFLIAPNAAPPGMAPGFLVALFVGIGAFNAIIATLYLVCGIFIRKGGFASAVLALVVACVHALIVLIMIIMVTVEAASLGFHGAAAGRFIFAISIYGIFLVALGQLIFLLIKVLREPRN